MSAPFLTVRVSSKMCGWVCCWCVDKRFQSTRAAALIARRRPSRQCWQWQWFREVKGRSAGSPFFEPLWHEKPFLCVLTVNPDSQQKIHVKIPNTYSESGRMMQRVVQDTSFTGKVTSLLFHNNTSTSYYHNVPDSIQLTTTRMRIWLPMTKCYWLNFLWWVLFQRSLYHTHIILFSTDLCQNNISGQLHFFLVLFTTMAGRKWKVAS